MCPFAVPESSDSSLTWSSKSSLAGSSKSTLVGGSVSSLASHHESELFSSHQPPPGPIGGSRSLEKLVTEGIVISAESTAVERKALPPAATEELKPHPHETSGEGLTRNKSSGSLLQHASVPSPFADLTLVPTATVSIGTQTAGVNQDSPKFTIGGGEEREAAKDSRKPHPPLDLPPVPRQVEECVAILKSEVCLTALMCLGVSFSFEKY